MEPPTLPSAKGLSHSASLPSERSPVEKPLGRSRNNWHGDLELDKAEMRWGSSADLGMLCNAESSAAHHAHHGELLFPSVFQMSFGAVKQCRLKNGS